MPKFYLVRHAVAMDREAFQKKFRKADYYRPLTEEGKKELAQTLKKLRKKKIKVKHVYHSPYLRCKESAEILAKAFELTPMPLKALAHQENEKVSSKKMLQVLSHVKKGSVFVGHEPELSQLVGDLDLEKTPFKKGELRCLRKKKKKGYKALWSLVPARKRAMPE